MNSWCSTFPLWLFLTIASATLIGCGVENSAPEPTSFNTSEKTEDIKKDSVEAAAENTNQCQCDWSKQELSMHAADLEFRNVPQEFEIDSIELWINNPERFNIKSLTLTNFDTIPEIFGIFENVETLNLRMWGPRDVQGLEVFRKLSSLQGEELRLIIDENDTWVENIESIVVNKSKFVGIKSFTELPNLKQLTMSFSGFDTFPKDLDQLACLHFFSSGAHTFSEIDLTELDFSNMSCLEQLEFQSWKKNLHGVPKGIEHIDDCNISHPNLTEEDKAILNN